MVAGGGTAPALGHLHERDCSGRKTYLPRILEDHAPAVGVGGPDGRAVRYALRRATAGALSKLSGEEDSIELRQSDLRRILGVTATVVSRMVRALERLGLVARRRETDGDRRQIQATLTKRGLETVKRACRLLIRGVRRIVYEAICYGHHLDPHARFVAMETLDSYLRALRKRFRDTATLYYRWGHPDD